MDIARVGSVSRQGWQECARLLGRLLADAALRDVERGELATVARDGGHEIVTLAELKGGQPNRPK